MKNLHVPVVSSAYFTNGFRENETQAQINWEVNISAIYGNIIYD